MPETFLYLLRPTRLGMLSGGATEEEERAVAGHFEYLQKAHAAGEVLLAGRTLTTGPETFGAVLLRSPSEEAARALMLADPAVAQGVMTAELFPFGVALGSPYGEGETVEDHAKGEAMKYVVESSKTVGQAQADLEEAVKRHHFGVLQVHDLQESMKQKGVDFDNECRILEICNPHKAKAVLEEDMSLNMALPCRISVWSQDGVTRIGMIRPQAMLAAFSDSKELMAVAKEVEELTIEMIEEAK